MIEFPLVFSAQRSHARMHTCPCIDTVCNWHCNFLNKARQAPRLNRWSIPTIGKCAIPEQTKSRRRPAAPPAALLIWRIISFENRTPEVVHVVERIAAKHRLGAARGRAKRCSFHVDTGCRYLNNRRMLGHLLWRFQMDCRHRRVERPFCERLCRAATW